MKRKERVIYCPSLKTLSLLSDHDLALVLYPRVYGSAGALLFKWHIVLQEWGRKEERLTLLLNISMGIS
jgi:hypothetical protein